MNSTTTMAPATRSRCGVPGISGLVRPESALALRPKPTSPSAAAESSLRSPRRRLNNRAGPKSPLGGRRCLRCGGCRRPEYVDEHGGEGCADEGEADAEVEELQDSCETRGRSDGEDFDEFEGHVDSASQCGTERTETAATNEEHRSKHGAAADEKKQGQPGDGEVGEDGALELGDGGCVEADEQADAAGHSGQPEDASEGDEKNVDGLTEQRHACDASCACLTSIERRPVRILNTRRFVYEGHRSDHQPAGSPLPEHKALATGASYFYWLRRYMAALAGRPPPLTSEQKLEHFLSALALRHDVAASTQNQAFHAIPCFSKDVLSTPLQNLDALRATRPAHLRHAPTVAETRALLQAVPDLAGFGSPEIGDDDGLFARPQLECGQPTGNHAGVARFPPPPP